MTDRPILFSASMILALLGGRKTQTRRILKPQPPEGARYSGIHYAGDEPSSHFFNSPVGPRKVRQKYEEGDRLWVRESFWIAEVAGQGIGEPFLVYDEEWTSGPGAREPKPAELRDGVGMGRWGRRPGIHMPRRASRLTLTVTDVRVQRLHEIDATDAIAEGIEYREGCYGTWNADGTMRCGGSNDPCEAYRCLWININGNGSWEPNPWIVALTFTVEKRNIDT